MDLEELAVWLETLTCGERAPLVVARYMAAAKACREAQAAKNLRAAPTLVHEFVLSRYDDAAEATNAALAECLP